MTERKKIIVIIGVILAIAILGALFYYFNFISKPKAHLILGVPYYGMFSGTILGADVESSVAMILRYWGDEHLTLEEIGRNFGGIEPGTLQPRYWDDLKKFFESQQYDIELKQFKNVGEIARFISTPPEIPLLISTPRTRSNGATFFVSAVLIGADPRANTITIHQSDRGNNYVLPARDLKFPILASVVKPGSAIQPSLNGPNRDVSYPKRIGIMDDLDIREVSTLWTEARFAERELTTSTIGKDQGKILEVMRKWEVVAKHSGFKKLHPAGRVLAYASQAYYVMEAGDYDLAIALLREKAIPLNHDLNKSYGEWPRDPSMHEKSTRPWLFLEMAYTGKGDLKNAQEAKEERLKILRERGEQP